MRWVNNAERRNCGAVEAQAPQAVHRGWAAVRRTVGTGLASAPVAREIRNRIRDNGTA
jgi:hypothetical protein